MDDDSPVSNPTANTGLVPVPEHQDRIAGLLGPTPVQELPTAECLGRALAEDLTAPVALPPFDNSAMDGYAIRAADLAGADAEPVLLPVTADIPAGRVDVPALLPGEAHRIMTGAQVPRGADAVVPVERTDAGTEQVRISAEVRAGAHIRRGGEDVTTGSTVLSAGTALSAAHLGVAAAVGAARLPVHRPARVLVLSTGSELVEPGEALRPGQIYESNGLMLAAAVREAGAEATLLRFVPDDVPAFHAALQPHLAGTDLVLTSGGVSAGAYEVVKDALTGDGMEFSKVAMQPGMPQGAGRYRGGPAVAALPGNPVSSLVSFEVFVRPALRSAAGHAHAHRPVRRAVLTEEISKPAGKRQFRRGLFDPAAGTVTLQGGPGSHLLSALAGANCLLDIPEEITELPLDSAVDVMLLD